MSYEVKEYRSKNKNLKDCLFFYLNGDIIWTESINPENKLFECNSLIDGNVEKIVIGRDERIIIKKTDKFPLSAITNLYIRFPNEKEYIGTGTIISKHYILTVAHNLYQDEKGGWAKEIRLFPGKSGSSLPFGSRDMDNMYIPQGWVESQDINYDFGLVEILNPFEKNTGSVGLLNHKDGFQGIMVSIIGYPVNKKNGNYLYCSRGLIEDTKDLKYEIDTSGGQSGSGLFYSYNKNIYTIGMHSKGEDMLNYGVSINQNNLKFIDEVINKKNYYEKIIFTFYAHFLCFVLLFSTGVG